MLQIRSALLQCSGGRSSSSNSGSGQRDKCVWCADGPGWWAQAYFTHTSASCFQRSRANRARVKGRRYRAQAGGLE
jgi:hypothetical protein